MKEVMSAAGLVALLEDWTVVTAYLRSRGHMKLPKGTISRWKKEVAQWAKKAKP